MNVIQSRDATIDAAMPVISVRSLVLAAPERGDDLRVRVSAPVAGTELPIIIFSHGFGASMDSYAPLVDYWAAQGFVVAQPTHLDAKRLAIPQDDPRQPDVWRFRVADLKHVLDGIDSLVAQVPGLSGRVDAERIAVAGHSYGAWAASMLLGARTIIGAGFSDPDWADARIKAGVLLATAGLSGEDMTQWARDYTPYLNSDFEELTTPTLMVMGDQDHSPLTTRGPDWFADAYRLSPGGKGLLTLFGGQHMLGGISGYGVTETEEENPAQVALVQQLTTAFLRSTLYPADPAWADASAALSGGGGTVGGIETK